ncbi:mitofusin-2-like [Amphiura filiformis]|uniref:mitofusin-2-like n=1 Tax=Amphiura filiformis TaxID=82378 RepID=UPI003B216549
MNTMSGYLQRSGSSRSNSVVSKPFSSMDPDINHSSTPLRLFVDAKKKVNNIYNEMATHVDESTSFIKGVPEDLGVVSTDVNTKIETFAAQVEGIREVLARDHMKVAFFGRTSNGKSTVVNAMLRDKVLPSGIGHTTDCFLSVEGSETDEAYLQIQDSSERMSIKSVGQLAHALHSERIANHQNTIVHIFWPKSRCHLLQNDVILLDSPGIDVEPNLDEWIDKHCMDADVFVLVSNAESTLMRTEKSFFHKVSERLSKPNIFILNNRWDASAGEEYSEAVKQQHMERDVKFLVEELKVITEQEAEDRVFFVSAKEALITRTPKAPSTPDSSGPLAEGYQARLFAFENFERQFEECISHTAVKTKFEQHAKKGMQIVSCVQGMLDEVHNTASTKRSSCIEKRKDQHDRLEYITQQLKVLSMECKDKIKETAELGETKVSAAMTDEIRKLSTLVDQFDKSFHSDPLVIKIYKEELQKHLESGLGRNLDQRCSGEVMKAVDVVQTEMTDNMSALLPDEVRANIGGMQLRRRFDLSYRLDCQHLFSDFRENVDFQFSLGLTSLMNRFLGPKGTTAAMLGFANVIPRPMPPAGLPPAAATNQDELAVAVMTGLASLTSKTSVGLTLVIGIVWKAVGWRLLAVSGSLYGLVYVYERLTWTNRAKERAFKKQFVSYASEKLQLLVNFTSSNLSHQIQQELSGTYARLCMEIETTKDNLHKEIVALEDESQKLDSIMAKSKVLRNKAGWLDNELGRFMEKYIKEE